MRKLLRILNQSDYHSQSQLYINVGRNLHSECVPLPKIIALWLDIREPWYLIPLVMKRLSPGFSTW